MHGGEDESRLLGERAGSVLTCQYDALDRMTAKIVPASAKGAPGCGVFYGYDNRALQNLALRLGLGAGRHQRQ